MTIHLSRTRMRKRHCLSCRGRTSPTAVPYLVFLRRCASRRLSSWRRERRRSVVPMRAVERSLLGSEAGRPMVSRAELALCTARPHVRALKLKGRIGVASERRRALSSSDPAQVSRLLYCAAVLGPLAPKASADRVQWCAQGGLPLPMRWQSLRAMAAVGGRCYTAATRAT